MIDIQKGKVSWRLTTDAPIDLNFAMYVACSYNIMPATTPFSRDQLWSASRVEIFDTEEQKILKDQWKHWWVDLVRDRAANGLHGRWSKYYGSNGYFELLDEPLRHRCEDVFHPFKDWWGMSAGGQQGVNYWDNFWDISANFRNYVTRVESEIKRTVNPFKLTVDYVYTGLNEILEINPSYVIISVQDPGTISNRDWWFKKVRELS